jgi:hypothetical protein
MLQWFADMFCTSESASKRPTMASDPVLQLVDHSLSYDTNTYLDKLISLAIVSPDYKAVLNRFVVISMTLTKTLSSPQHEFLVLMLMDTDNSGSVPYLMFLERTKSKKRLNPISSFLDHPDNAAVLASIIETLKGLPSSLLSSVPSTSDSEDESSPDADSSDSPSNISPSDPLLGSTSSPSPSNQSLLRNLIDSGTLVSVSAIHTSIESTGKLQLAYARDQFTGGKDVNASGSVLGQVVWQIQPQSLSLFQVVVLADVVHNYAPLYSLFRRQCYWFAFIICAVTLKTCICSSIGSPDLHMEDICIPPNSYLPNLAGRWMGILVRGVEEAVLEIMIEKYRARCDEKLNEVSCIFYSEKQLINFEYSWRRHGVASVK